MDAFILSLIPATADPRIRDVVALVLAHKGATVLAFLLSSGLGAQILIRILNAIPMAWWYSGLRAVAAAAGGGADAVRDGVFFLEMADVAAAAGGLSACPVLAVRL